MISIHTPTKGATLFVYTLFQHLHYFNPHSHEGSDLFSLANFASSSVFQSTLPRRERPSLTPIHTSPILFQSTLPRRERRLSKLVINDLTCISIHTPTKGATTCWHTLEISNGISIHTPTKGATVKWQTISTS